MKASELSSIYRIIKLLINFETLEGVLLNNGGEQCNLSQCDTNVILVLAQSNSISRHSMYVALTTSETLIS
jgi:hypothetical protein